MRLAVVVLLVCHAGSALADGLATDRSAVPTTAIPAFGVSAVVQRGTDFFIQTPDPIGTIEVAPGIRTIPLGNSIGLDTDVLTMLGASTEAPNAHRP